MNMLLYTYFYVLCSSNNTVWPVVLTEVRVCLIITTCSGGFAIP